MQTASDTSVADILVPKVSAYVYDLFKKRLPKDVLYHSYEHTFETAKAAEKIGKDEGLDETELLLVTLAAWFHDAGYTEGHVDHERRSVAIAHEFLKGEQLTRQQRQEVERLILSTRPEHEPEDLLERVLHDADVVHIGKRKKFFRFSELLRQELERRQGRVYSEQEWAEVQLDFLTRTDFRTETAQNLYGEARRDNLVAVQEKLASVLHPQKAAPAPKPEKKSPSRGIETMFRTAYRNHINLSQIADSKANIMISINAILMSIIVSFVSTRLQSEAWLLVPAVIMLVTSLVAIVFAILGARPKVTSRYYTLEDVRNNQANILFFGNFAKMPLEDFSEGMRELMGDWDKLYDSMINDLYALGKVLDRKYKLLWLSYSSFMFGLIVTVISLLILYFTGARPSAV